MAQRARLAAQLASPETQLRHGIAPNPRKIRGFVGDTLMEGKSAGLGGGGGSLDRTSLTPKFPVNRENTGNSSDSGANRSPHPALTHWHTKINSRNSLRIETGNSRCGAGNRYPKTAKKGGIFSRFLLSNSWLAAWTSAGHSGIESRKIGWLVEP